MAADRVSGQGPGLTGPVTEAVAVTPNDSADVVNASGAAETTRGLWVGTGGNLAVRMKGQVTSVTFANVPNGSLLPIRVDRVLNTGTTASGIVALF